MQERDWNELPPEGKFIIEDPESGEKLVLHTKEEVIKARIDAGYDLEDTVWELDAEGFHLQARILKG